MSTNPSIKAFPLTWLRDARAQQQPIGGSLMSAIFIHPHVCGHPGRIAALEQRTGLRAVIINSRPQLVRASDAPPRYCPRFLFAAISRLRARTNNPPGPEAA